MAKPLIFICLLAIQYETLAQVKYITGQSFSQDEQEVFETVLTLFDGMREGDSAKVHSAFRDNPEMCTSFTDKEGNPQLRIDSGLQNFLNAVGTPHDMIWDEPLWNVKINIDDNLAMVWTDYAFYLGKQFSHCGVDAFLLNKDDEGWKIFHLTDTRRRSGCEVPDKIKAGRE